LLHPDHAAVTGAWARGDFKTAKAAALRWRDQEPGDVMPYLLLAETASLTADHAGALDALRAAQRVDEDHPMYQRAVCVCALAARAFTAAHGAAYGALLVGLPGLLVADLQQKLSAHVVASPRGYPVSENDDPAWRNLLGPVHHVRHDPVRLLWAEAGGKFVVNEEQYVEAAISVLASDSSWTTRASPRMLAYLRHLGRGSVPEEIEPWMFQSPAICYVGMLLHVSGRFPRSTPYGVLHEAPEGWLIMEQGGPKAMCVSGSRELMDVISRTADLAYEGRISLVGPDERLGRVGAWLHSALEG
jgi:hypothetical protein